MSNHLHRSSVLAILSRAQRKALLACHAHGYLSHQRGGWWSPERRIGVADQTITILLERELLRHAGTRYRRMVRLTERGKFYASLIVPQEEVA